MSNSVSRPMSCLRAKLQSISSGDPLCEAAVDVVLALALAAASPASHITPAFSALDTRCMKEVQIRVDVVLRMINELIDGAIAEASLKREASEGATTERAAQSQPARDLKERITQTAS